MANQGFSRIFSWCETPPGSTKEVECACVPIHNASKLQGLPIDPDLDTTCVAGDILIWDGTEWVCGDAPTGPTGPCCTGPTGPTGPGTSATGFLSNSDCTFGSGTGFVINSNAFFTRINNVCTISWRLFIADAGTVTAANNIGIICNFPTLPPNPDFGATSPGAAGGFGIASGVPQNIGATVISFAATSWDIEIFSNAALVAANNDTLEVQATATYFC
jgi:hypothetical protein